MMWMAMARSACRSLQVGGKLRLAAVAAALSREMEVQVTQKLALEMLPVANSYH